MGSNSKETRKSENLECEAIICGEGIPALFAGFILKKNRIRFAICPESVGEAANLEISEEHTKKAEVIFGGISVQVGFNPKSEDEKELASGKDRLEKYLLYELEEESKNSPETDILKELAGQGVTVIEAYGNEWIGAGSRACALVETRQKRMEQYMQRLRIKSGKRAERKLVYATQSKSWFYAREAVMRFTVEQGVAAVNPFMNFGYYLGGEADKDEISECCHEIIRNVSEMWVFGPVSEAILTDIVAAVMEGKEIRFFSVSENPADIHEIPMDEIIFEREVHAGQIKKADLLNFVRSTLPRSSTYVQMSLFDDYEGGEGLENE